MKDTEKQYAGASGTQFDQTVWWDRECKPILDELIRQCRIYQVPFFWTACVANGSHGSVYHSDCAGPASMGLTLRDDQIAKHLSILRGFTPVPPCTGDPVHDMPSSFLTEAESEEPDEMNDEDVDFFSDF